MSAQKRQNRRGWGERHQLDQWKYTPLYEKDIKEVGNKSMETNDLITFRE